MRLGLPQLACCKKRPCKWVVPNTVAYSKANSTEGSAKPSENSLAKPSKKDPFAFHLGVAMACELRQVSKGTSFRPNLHLKRTVSTSLANDLQRIAASRTSTVLFPFSVEGCMVLGGCFRSFKGVSSNSLPTSGGNQEHEPGTEIVADWSVALLAWQGAVRAQVDARSSMCTCGMMLSQHDRSERLRFFSASSEFLERTEPGPLFVTRTSTR